jgi:hypothetical protein
MYRLKCCIAFVIVLPVAFVHRLFGVRRPPLTGGTCYFARGGRDPRESPSFAGSLE